MTTAQIRIDGARMSVRYASATAVGNVRSINEDSVLCEPPMFMVADGMGGHEAGEVASAIAVDEFSLLRDAAALRIEDLGTTLGAAERRIAALGDGGPHAAGTTVALVATMAIDEVAYWVVLNLGDSRVYRLSGEIFEQVSVDHSVVQEMVDLGELTESEARNHPQRHMITRALGAAPGAEPDYWLIPVETGDRMLLCSDGLSGEVTDDVIERSLRAADDPADACAVLVDLALAAGGHDNVSVVVVEAWEVDGARDDGNDALDSTSPSRVVASPDVTDGGVDEDTVPRASVTEDGAER